MKKISIFIQNEIIYRNFYKSGSFDNLKDYEIFFLTPSSLKLDFDNKKKIYYNKNANIDKYTNKLFNYFAHGHNSLKRRDCSHCVAKPAFSPCVRNLAGTNVGDFSICNATGVH